MTDFVGPWGSLVSFVLGVHVTPVQIWAGPPLSQIPVLLRGFYVLSSGEAIDQDDQHIVLEGMENVL